MNFTEQVNIDMYDANYTVGYKHDYPNSNIVKLVYSYFGHDGGGAKVLDYGCGIGCNLLMLLQAGYHCTGIDVSKVALQTLDMKLKNMNYPSRYHLDILNPSDNKLPYDDATFDYLLSNEAILMLASEEKVKALILEFKRVLKPGAKMIVSFSSRLNTFCIDGKPLGNHVYEYIQGTTKMPCRVFICEDESHLRKLFSDMEIEDIGYTDIHFRGIRGHQYIILAANR
jgi:ubiquinone/menaquinone biosynthesis C-methylase UbiE